MFDEYAQLYPESQFPALRPPSQPSSIEGNRVALPTAWAAIWSTEIPDRILAPLVLRGWAPVRNTEALRA
jgi:hypothetical protein